MRFSKQRQAILDIVLNGNNHPTADYIYSELKKDYPELSLGTVYRNLSLLSEKGLIQKVSIQNHSDMFDKNLDHHAHIVCSICGDVCDIDTGLIDNIMSNISNDNNILIKSYDITFDGICNKCKEKKIKL
ncbi:Fur family transcriptional regulator [Faecalimicrobium sp. JNUCC 81]